MRSRTAQVAAAQAQAATLPGIETQLSQAQGRVQELEQAAAERTTLKADWLVVGTALGGIIRELQRRVVVGEPTGKNPLVNAEGPAVDGTRQRWQAPRPRRKSTA